MTAPTSPHVVGPPTSPTDFLGGVERRAAVFAELLCGERLRGDKALAAAMRAFADVAARDAVPDLPRLFWGLLLATPQLREVAPRPRWPAPLSALAPLGTGQRAALLLRLVAGLHDTEAAAVLGIAPATYRLALQHALPHRPNGSPDVAAWQALAEALQRALREGPVARSNPVPKQREAASRATPPWRSRAYGGPDARPRWLRPLLGTGLAACTIAFIGTFFLPAMLRVGDLPPIQVTPLPAAESPAATFDADTALLTHRDFDQLADAREEPLVQALDFYAWYAAQSATQPTGAPLLLPDAGTPSPVPKRSHAPH